MLESVGHYKILDRIGPGGIGEIYRARDTKHGRTVAIQVLAPDVAADPVRRGQFLEQARAVSVLSHPNIATLYEVGEEQGVVYIACEFNPGSALTAVVAGRSLSPRRAVEFATQLADALADAHAEDIVHGDLRTGTVTVTPKDKVKVLDFGLAPWKKGGTAHAGADTRADIAALGVVLYEMLTGTAPARNAPAPPGRLNPDSPAELDPIVLKALARSGGDGYQSAATLAAELRSVAAILDVRSGDKEPPNLAPARQQKSTMTGPLLIAVILAALAGLVWYAL
jgi:serine/threonine-protein kinase